MRIQSKLFAFLTAIIVSHGQGAFAATIPVPPGGGVQDAIDAAADGDTIALQPGVYPGDIDFMGKAIAVVGVGEATVISGSGAGPVVRLVDCCDRRMTSDTSEFNTFSAFVTNQLPSASNNSS